LADSQLNSPLSPPKEGFQIQSFLFHLGSQLFFFFHVLGAFFKKVPSFIFLFKSPIVNIQCSSLFIQRIFLFPSLFCVPKRDPMRQTPVLVRVTSRSTSFSSLHMWLSVVSCISCLITDGCNHPCKRYHTRQDNHAMSPPDPLTTPFFYSDWPPLFFFFFFFFFFVSPSQSVEGGRPLNYVF